METGVLECFKAHSPQNTLTRLKFLSMLYERVCLFFHSFQPIKKLRNGRGRAQYGPKLRPDITKLVGELSLSIVDILSNSM